MGKITVLLSVALLACHARPQPQTTPRPELSDADPAPTETRTNVTPRTAAIDPTLFQQPQPPYAPPNPPPTGQPPPYAPPNPQPPYQPPYQQPSQPPPALPPLPPEKSHIHDGEVIGDFTAVGVLAGIDIIVRQDVQNGGTGTLILIGSIFAGGAGGWLLTQKYEIDGGAAHSTTLGLLVGAANGALLIEPTGWQRPESVLGLLFVGSAIGAGSGFIYGQTSDLTPGQATFVANATLLGIASAALGAITGSQDGEFGDWENGSLALGLDAGLVAGALIAPRLDWSPKRSKIVFAATGVGALIGGMLAGLTTSKKQSDGTTDRNSDLVAACMTAGMWGGFGLGVLMTRDSVPDPKYGKPASNGSTPTSYAPWVGREGQFGVLAGGTW